MNFIFSRRIVGNSLLSFLTLPGCSVGEEPSHAQVKTTAPAKAPGATPRMVLQDFNGPTVPINGSGDTYPSEYYSDAYGGGKAVVSLDSGDAIEGKSLRLRLTSGALYAQFNPYNANGTRSFARDYSSDPAGWQFDTYNRMSFWIRVPTSAPPLGSSGRPNVEFGTYVKRAAKPDLRSDEAGGDHYYHLLNLPNIGQWTRVVINMHPDHARGTGGGVDPGVRAHPTGEAAYNYFDTLTRFYLSNWYNVKSSSYPTDYLFDDIEFYREPSSENDMQAYSLAATYDAGHNRLIVTWSRALNDNGIPHEIRYSFADIHRTGWGAAAPAPKGVLKPPGFGGYNGMIYDTTELPLAGRDVVYVAIKPRNSGLFSQIALPLKHPSRSVGRLPGGTPPGREAR